MIGSFEERAKIDKFFREWIDRVPYVPFDPAWEARAIPPFGGAIVRYIVDAEGESFSIYLDADNSMGFHTDADGNLAPYWEIMPGTSGDPERFDMDDVEGLVNEIRAVLATRPADQEGRDDG